MSARRCGRWKRRCSAEIALAEVVAAHLAAGGSLAGDALWKAEAGEIAARFVEEFIEAADGMPGGRARRLCRAVPQAGNDKAVRLQRSGHPRVSILGPLEARLQSFDTVVLGGLNEGTWPRAPGADPWFSRPMRNALGLEQPERAIGQAAHDFAMLCAGPRVILTRAQKFEGVPAIASRWVQRLTQLTNGLGLKDALKPDDGLCRAGRRLNDAGRARIASRCRARAAVVAARPKRLPVTEIETWVRDPYAIYARRILKLRVLDPLDAEIGPLERGSAVHLALERLSRIIRATCRPTRR